MKLAEKIGHLKSSQSILKVKYSLNLSKNDFFLKNTELEEKLSLKSFFILFIFEKLYLVDLCPIFVALFPILSDSWQKNKYTVLISVERGSFRWMCNLLLVCWMDSNTQSVALLSIRYTEVRIAFLYCRGFFRTENFWGFALSLWPVFVIFWPDILQP